MTRSPVLESDRLASHGSPSTRGFGLPRSLRVRLILAVLAVDLLSIGAIGAVVVVAARISTRAEIASSIQLAELLTADTLQLLKDAPAPILLKSLDLHIQQLRHVRIAVFDASGRAIEPDKTSLVHIDTSEAPAWFTRLTSPASQTKDFPVVVRGQVVGRVAVRSEPGDEAREAWTNGTALIATMLLIDSVVLALLYALFGHLLYPLQELGSGLRTIAAKNYGVRLSPPKLLELATITDVFNETAQSLAETQIDNQALHYRLLSAQDDERRRTALELHDEVGPCLFALEANATSVANCARTMADQSLIERADDLIALVNRVQRSNRRVLDRLRPIALEQLPLADALTDVLIDFEDAGSQLVVDPSPATWRRTYGQLVDLTIYRCVQAALTNAVRHARAERVVLTIKEEQIQQRTTLLLRIEDNGCGLVEPVRAGLGLPGMRERVDALSGSFDLSSSDAGTVITIRLPLEASVAAGSPIGVSHGGEPRCP